MKMVSVAGLRAEVRKTWNASLKGAVRNALEVSRRSKVTGKLTASTYRLSDRQQNRRSASSGCCNVLVLARAGSGLPRRCSGNRLASCSCRSAARRSHSYQQYNGRGTR
ncbi:hypothetical protein KCP75_00835 [Salmonella enterica subsp. enterica]|nr:hypothetical protein KCP75_00835 [Salmonella enterica subsp. enterica]